MNPDQFRVEAFRVGVDIGGTFTDFVLIGPPGEKVRVHKQLTTPRDPAEAVIEGLQSLCAAAGIRAADIGRVVHGTTLVTNAIIERKGVPTAMLVTSGFRDTLDIARETRYDLFDLRIKYPSPVVPRNLRFEVDGRLKADGTEETALVLGDRLRAAIANSIEQDRLESVAVCLLHSYRDDRHEREAAAWLRRYFPNLSVSISSMVVPFMREYERWTTTCLNAYVQPVVGRYLAALECGLAGLGFRGKLLIMSSSGGTLTSDIAREFPVRLLESGPAAGALMSARHGSALGDSRLLAFDMGGTTAKGCIVQDGRPLKRYELEVARVHEFKKGSGLPAKIPVIDMIEIGAGGGSLARIDERGTLRVGPRSAGAEPGPVCYGRGGRNSTLTDANLVLGYLSTASFLGGRMALDVAGARDAIGNEIARPLGVELERAAWGIHEVINEDVARAFRVHASERGIDCRNGSVVVFGGSGPLHGARVARKLRISRVLCPTGAGVLSAFGLLVSPISFETVRSGRIGLDALSQSVFTQMRNSLSELSYGFLERAGVDREEVRVAYKLDMRYVGQGYEIEVALPSSFGGEMPISELTALFTRAYRQIFGVVLENRPVEIVNWKIEASGPSPEDIDFSLAPGGADAPKLKNARPAYFPEMGGFVNCPVYNRYALELDDKIAGPALIEENESTCVLPPGDILTVDRHGNLVIDIQV